MSTTEVALTAHLVLPDGHPGDEFLMTCAAELRRRFGIGHTTLQIEISAETACRLASDNVVLSPTQMNEGRNPFARDPGRFPGSRCISIPGLRTR